MVLHTEQRRHVYRYKPYSKIRPFQTLLTGLILDMLTPQAFHIVITILRIIEHKLWDDVNVKLWTEFVCEKSYIS